MPLCVLLDQGAPRRAAQALRDLGVDAVHVGERAMERASDQQIMEVAALEGRCVVTFDHDFGSLALSGATGPSVMFVRRHVPAVEFASFVIELLTAHADALAAGAILSVRPESVRSAALPIQRSTREGNSSP